MSELNDLIHAPARLKIMASLVELGQDSEITFTRLQDLLGMTPGNLSAHLKKLERVNYLTITKSFTPRGVTQTCVRVTGDGIAAFTAHVEQLKNIVGGRLLVSSGGSDE